MAYDQEFFLSLAAKGKGAWNAWRRDAASKDVSVTFAGTDFSEAPRDGIDFSGFEFGDHADFSDCKWPGAEWLNIQEDPRAFKPGRACFTGAAFGKDASFYGAAFGNYASFYGAGFGNGAYFYDAAFGYGANFDRAAFGKGVYFYGAAFGEWASFDGVVFVSNAIFDYATFSSEANFDGAAFGDRASFYDTTFGALANFAGATFGDGAKFTGTAFGDWASFAGTVFKGRVEFTGEQWSRELEADADEKAKKAHLALKKRHEDSWKYWDSRPDRFSEISFANARFDGEAVFSGRTFKGDTDFTSARFYYPPNFDAAAKDARVDFTGAYIGFGHPLRFDWTSETNVPLRLRALRKLAEETKNHDLERDLYIEERKAERGVFMRQRWEDLKKKGWKNWPLISGRLLAHLLWIVVMGAYWALADYGRSFVRPFAWLIASGFAFYWGYLTVLARLMPKTCPLGDKYDQAVRMLALGNAVPFVGPITIDAEIKKFLFCPNNSASCLPPIPPEGFQALVIVQNLVSITCVFFIGLALRNYFRIK